MHPLAALVVVAHALVWLGLVLSAAGARRWSAAWRPAVALVLAASLALSAYALVLDAMLETLAAFLRDDGTGESRSPGWFARQGLASLARLAPGGPVAVLAFVMLALAVAALGVGSYARQSRAVLGVLLGGVLVTVLALALLRQDLGPRFLFVGSAGLALVVGRGLVEWVRQFSRAPPLWGWRNALERAVLVLTCLVSAASVPRAWAPKQDFVGALAYLEARAAPEDAIVTAGLATLALRELHQRSWPAAETVEELQRIEAAHPRTWLVLCGPIRLESSNALLWDHVEADYDRAAVFPGTASDGEVVVLLHNR